MTDVAVAFRARILGPAPLAVQLLHDGAMVSAWLGRFGSCLVLGALWSWTGPAQAQQLDAAARGREWVGVELTPVSLGLGSGPDGRAPQRLQAGGGGTLRLLRRAWGRGYLVPLEGGGYLGNGSDTIFLFAAVEGGAMLGRWDLGLAAGAGMLAMSYGQGCDGSCLIGGAGPLLAPVVRYTFVEHGAVTLAALTRLVIPLHRPSGDWFGHYSGRGVLLLAGFEVAVR